MDFLLDPNVAYFFLVTGVLCGLLAIITPGTGLLEVLSLGGLAVAAYRVLSLGANPWGAALLVLSLAPFLAALRSSIKQRQAWVLLSLLLQGVGAYFFFTDARGWPQVHPVVAIVISFLYGVFLYLAVKKMLEVLDTPRALDPQALVGATGETKTEVFRDGSVLVNGERWTARSEKPIPAGVNVRVVHRDGLTLTIEEIP